MQQDGFANDVWNFGLFLVEVLRPIVNQKAKNSATLFHLLHEYRETELDMTAVFGMLTWDGLPEFSVVHSHNTAESKEDMSDAPAAPTGQQSSSMYMRNAPQVRAVPLAAVGQQGLYDQSPAALAAPTEMQTSSMYLRTSQSSSMYMLHVSPAGAVSQYDVYDRSADALPSAILIHPMDTRPMYDQAVNQSTIAVSVNESLSVSAVSQSHSPDTAPSQEHDVDNRYAKNEEVDDGYSIDFEVKHEEVNEAREPYSWTVPCIVDDVPVLNHPFMEWLARWCTRIRPEDRPSMRMVACLIQTLARTDGSAGGFAALPAMYLAFDERSLATVDGCSKKDGTSDANLLHGMDVRAAASVSASASVDSGPAIVESAASFDPTQALDTEGATTDTRERQCMPMAVADWKFLSLVWTRAAGSSIEWCGAVMSEADRYAEPTHRVVNFAFNCIGQVLQVRTYAIQILNEMRMRGTHSSLFVDG
jgi:hypothetical protein